MSKVRKHESYTVVMMIPGLMRPVDDSETWEDERVREREETLTLGLVGGRILQENKLSNEIDIYIYIHTNKCVHENQ